MQTVRGWKKIFHANGNQKKARVGILILHKIDFKIKSMLQETKKDTTLNNKGINPREDTTIVTIYIYICTQHRSTSIYKANIHRHKRRN